METDTQLSEPTANNDTETLKRPAATTVKHGGPPMKQPAAVAASEGTIRDQVKSRKFHELYDSLQLPTEIAALYDLYKQKNSTGYSRDTITKLINTIVDKGGGLADC